MKIPACLGSRYFYLTWLALWLISLSILGGKAVMVVPGIFLFIFPGFILGESLFGGHNVKNPGPLVSSILIGMLVSAFALLLSGKYIGFYPIANLITLLIVNILTMVNFTIAQPDEGLLRTRCFQTQDYYAIFGILCFLIIFILPAFMRVGQQTSLGYAYTQWYSLDFLLSKSVVASLSHGTLPPPNPYYVNLPLRYHYLFHILPAYLYQLTASSINLESLILFLYFLVDLLFLVSIYLLISEKLSEFTARVAVLILILVANSLEGTYFIFQFLGRAPLSNLITRNLEMRFVPSLLTPYLHLLYIVPHLFTGSYLYLLYQLLTKRTGWRNYLLCGLIIGACSGMSVFMSATLLWFSLLIILCEKIRHDKYAWAGIILVLIGALLINSWLNGALKMFKSPDLTPITRTYKAFEFNESDKINLKPSLFGINRFLLTKQFGFMGPPLQIAAEALPSLVFLFLGLYLMIRQKSLTKFSVETIMALSFLFAYLFIAISPQNRLIAHKSSLPLYIFSAYVGGLAFESRDKTRKLAWGLLVVFLILSLPTLIINFVYITKLDNQKEVTYLSRSDQKATTWIKNNLPPRAVVQCFPNYPAWPHRYSLIPMFAERDTGVGAFKRTRDAVLYQSLAINEVKKISLLYSPKTPLNVMRQLLKSYQIDYLYFGPVEKRVFGWESFEFLQNQKDLYREVYNEEGVIVFQVIK